MYFDLDMNNQTYFFEVKSKANNSVKSEGKKSEIKN